MTHSDNGILDRTECSVLRGLAIISIILHNYLHWFPYAIPESEFMYNADSTKAFIHFLAHPDGNWMNQIIAYFGHYGVEVFVFMSGVGLAVKYGSDIRRRVTVSGFIAYHYLKLFRLCAVGVLFFYLVLCVIMPDPDEWPLPNLLFTLFMIGDEFRIFPIVGPFWFFSMILQLYVIYRLFIYCRGTRSLVWLTAGCVLLGYLLLSVGHNGVYYKTNFFGHMLSFSLGILAVRYRDVFHRFLRPVRVSAIGLIVSLPVIVVFDLCEYTWLLTPGVVCVNALFIGQLLRNFKMVYRMFEWIGGISATIFITHPVVRALFYRLNNPENWLNISLYLLFAIMLGAIFKWIMRYIPSPSVKIEKASRK